MFAKESQNSKIVTWSPLTEPICFLMNPCCCLSHGSQTLPYVSRKTALDDDGVIWNVKLSIFTLGLGVLFFLTYLPLASGALTDRFHSVQWSNGHLMFAIVVFSGMKQSQSPHWDDSGLNKPQMLLSQIANLSFATWRGAIVGSASSLAAVSLMEAPKLRRQHSGFSLVPSKFSKFSIGDPGCPNCLTWLLPG